MPASTVKIARFGLFEADLQHRVLTKDGLRVKLQDQPFEILMLLLQRPGEIVTREEIQQTLWPADTYVAFDAGLNTAIKKLRLGLGDSPDNPRFIETVPRRGYRFLASPVFAETAVSGRGSGDDDRVSSVVAELATDKGGESEVLKSGSRRQVLVWAGLVFASALFGTGLTIWRKNNIAPGAAESAAISARVASNHSNRSAGRAVDPRAREEYLQARNYWKERTAEALTKAVDRYNLAIELAPDYAEAYAGLANCYVVLPMVTTVSTEDSYPKAMQAAEKAIALDDSLAQAHLAAAEIKLYADWNFPGAEKKFRRAIELDSNDAQVHQWYAEFLSLMGRHPEAIGQIRAAQHLDPASMIIHHQAGQIFQAARMYPEALQEYRQALMIQPGFGPTYSVMALAYLRQGRYPESLDAHRQATRYWDPGGTAIKDLQRVTDAYRAGGKQAFLRASLEFDKKHPPRAYYFAHDYALLGENDQAVQLLRKVLEAHQAEILNLQNDPEFDHLKSDPRFQEIAMKVGLSPTTESLAMR